jgi:ribosomal protein L37AE/L43A
MHLIERTGALAELDEIYRQWRAGALTNAEYHTAFAMIDAAHSHDHMCDNGDKRRADRIVRGRMLCSVCAWKDHEARS